MMKQRDANRRWMKRGAALAATVVGVGLMSACGAPAQASDGGAAASDHHEAPAQRVAIDDAADVVMVLEDENYRMIRAAELVGGEHESCIDGRADEPVVGTPGGDAGEILIALDVLEELRGEAISRSEIAGLLDRWYRAFGPIYLHSDDHAMEALHAHLSSSLEGVPDDIYAFEAWLLDVPAELQATVLQALGETEHIGCGHLKSIASTPQDYGVRDELVAIEIQTLFAEHWAGRIELDFVVLHGGHEEQAVVVVDHPHEVHAYTTVPAIQPHGEDYSVFVSHPGVADYLRREETYFLIEAYLESDDSIEGVGHEAFLDQLNIHAADWSRLTIEALAPTLPVFHVRATDDGIEVERAR